MEKEIILKNDSGLHARPAGLFVKEASRFTSEIKVAAKGQTVNAKSIMSLMTLGLEKGDKITLSAEGPDEIQAIECLGMFLSQQTH